MHIMLKQSIFPEAASLILYAFQILAAQDQSMFVDQVLETPSTV